MLLVGLLVLLFHGCVSAGSACVCAYVCLGVGGRCDIFNVGVGVTVFVGIVLAVDGEVVDGRIMSDICAFIRSQK